MVCVSKDTFLREIKFTNVWQKCHKYSLRIKSSVSVTDALPGKRPMTQEELMGGEVILLPHTPARLLIIFIIIYENTLYKQSGSGELVLFLIWIKYIDIK